MSFVRLVLALSMAFSAAGATSAQPARPAAGAVQPTHGDQKEVALVEQLLRGGLVLYFRHERTELERTQDDRPLDLSDCAKQRVLSAAGYVSAQNTGEALRLIGVPIGAVISSPLCRSVDTAKAAFGRADIDPRLRGGDLDTGRTGDNHWRDIRRVAAEHPTPGANLVLVSHYLHTALQPGVNLAEGDAAVFRPAAKGDLILLGTISSQRWGDVVRDFARAGRLAPQRWRGSASYAESAKDRSASPD